MKKNIYLTFDVEDWFQVENLRSLYPPETWEKQKLNVEDSTDIILNLLDKHNVKATFFILGWIAERKPDLVKKIHNKGHEIASHGYGHLLNYNLSKKELEEDLKKSKFIIEDLIGEEVVGYRAPSFSISDELLDILYNLGYKYDSSYNAFSIHDRYGKIELENENNQPFLHKSGILEFPLPLVEVFKKKVPISGGGYFRLFPSFIFNNLVKKYMKNHKDYVFYVHPWEFDINQPKLKNIKLSYRFRHYIGIKKSREKLEKFILTNKKNNFRYRKIKNFLKEV